MAMVVFHGVANIVSACNVWCPGFINFRDNMSFDFASEGCKVVASHVARRDRCRLRRFLAFMQGVACLVCAPPDLITDPKDGQGNWGPCCIGWIQNCL